MEEMIFVNSDNNYEIPHMGKAALDWMGLLPDRLVSLGEGAIELACTFLNEEF